MDIKSALAEVVEGRSLTESDMESVMRAIMSGESTPAQIGGLLVALRLKGETIDELTAAARIMREFSLRVEVDADHLIDTCGTGGDGTQTFNISTTAAFVAAGAGAHVAKHGNRSVSSASGSADVLEAAGVRLDLEPEAVAQCIREAGVGFMFAPTHHAATRYAAGPRRELGIRTMFNALGPLTNPAGAPNQVVGVFEDRWIEPAAEALRRLGSRHVMVVHAADGMDEISIAAPTRVAELRDGEISLYSVSPADFDIAVGSIDALIARDPAASLAMLRSVLANEPGPARDIVALNAGAAIYVAGLAPDLATGIRRAFEVLESGAAAARLESLIKLSNDLAPD